MASQAQFMYYDSSLYLATSVLGTCMLLTLYRDVVNLMMMMMMMMIVVRRLRSSMSPY